MKVVLASGNRKKLAELSAILQPLGWELIPQGVLGVQECAEPFDSFIENALVKARHAAQQTGLPALADDSGLCVDALLGAPGVLSARYAGEPCSDENNNRKLLEALTGEANRRARFVCAIAYVRHAKDPQPIIAEGEWVGDILEKPCGTGGFGYDPLFFVKAYGCTSAELDAATKNRHSHRGEALKNFVARLQERV